MVGPSAFMASIVADLKVTLLKKTLAKRFNGFEISFCRFQTYYFHAA